MDRVRLLLVEDSDDDAVLIVKRLRREGFDVSYERVENAPAMAASLRQHPPDVVISDNRMPTFDARAALGLVHEAGLDVPFIVVSGQIGEEAAADLMRMGAHDFILKDSLTRLVPVVEREVGEARRRDERRRALAALHTSEERFRLVAEHLQDVLFKYRLEPTASIEYISPAAETLIGHSPRRLCEDAGLLFSVVHPDDRPVLEQSWRAPPDQPVVVRIRRPDGGHAWLEQRAVAVRDDRGRLVAVEGILRDITAQLSAAEEREQLERQLRQAERLDSLGQLAGGIAHDFNNLLGVIRGYAGLAAEAVDPGDPLGADLEGIIQAADQAARLTRQLLIFSRSQPSNPETIDVNAVVRDTEQLLRRTIGEDIAFVVETGNDQRYVTIDQGRLEQIILNLIVNSRTAMPDGGRLTVTTATATADELAVLGRDQELPLVPFVRLTVADTGCGMTPEVAERAFEPFFSTKGTDDSTSKGSGLGLATVYGAVRDAGGTVRLWSRPGEGTRISIYLPAAATPPRTDSLTDPASGTSGAEHVLVVEDDDAVREVARRILTRAGFTVTVSATRDDAVARLTGPDRDVQLLLTDVVMPGMPAVEFIDLVRAHQPELPIVLMSGYAEGLNRDGRPLPENIPLVAKPFDGPTLQRAIRTALDRREREPRPQS